MTRLTPAWLAEPAVRRLLAALAAAGIEARFVGGCVRDALLDEETGDIDLATPASPETVHGGARRRQDQGAADRDRAWHGDRADPSAQLRDHHAAP